MAKELQPISKGLSQDFNQEFQQEGTYRFMLNGMIESTEGERGGLLNERGNKIILNLPTDIGDPNLVGHCLLPNQDKVLFLTGNDGQQEIQIIGLHKENNTWQELIRTDCLEFNKCDQVDCIFKIHNGCEIIIYFTDHKSTYKSINISSIQNSDRYQKFNYIDYLGGNNPNLPTVNPTVGIGSYGWNCSSFSLTPVSKHPSLYFHKEGVNGNLRRGTYTFFIRLLDLDLNPTDWLTWTNPISVKEGSFNFESPPDNNDGTYIDPTAENFTAKSITLILNNLDTSFKYYEIGVIERSLDTNTPSFVYRTGQRLLPPSGNDTFIFNNVSDTRFTNITIASILTRTRKIDVVQAHTQINNRLILGNLTTTSTDWAEFQRSANNIKVEYFTYNEVEINDVGCGTKKHFVASGDKAVPPGQGFQGVNYSSPEFLSYGMSLMRDEVYALGIIYVFKNGTESPVFHIPGRMKYSINGAIDSVSSDIIGGFDYASYATLSIQSLSSEIWASDALRGATLGITSTLSNFDNRTLNTIPHTPVNGSWFSNRLTNLPQNNILSNVSTDEYKYLYGYNGHITCCYSLPLSNTSCSSTGLERWQYYNTAIRRKVGTGTDPIVMESCLTIDVQPPTQVPTTPETTFTVTYTIDGVPGQFNQTIPTTGATFGSNIEIICSTGTIANAVLTVTNDNNTGRPSNLTITTPAITSSQWMSLDDTPTLSGDNPSYTFDGGFRGVPGYFDTGISYPDIKDCEGVRIFPTGNVRHHRMPDHKIEQLYDMVGDPGVGTVTGNGLTTNAAWKLTSNITTDQKTNSAVNDWQMNNSESTLKLYPLGLNFHNVAPPEAYRDKISGYYIVRSDRSNNKTVIDKGFMNVCDTNVSIRSWADGNNFGLEATDSFSNLGTNYLQLIYFLHLLNKMIMIGYLLTFVRKIV